VAHIKSTPVLSGLLSVVSSKAVIHFGLIESAARRRGTVPPNSHEKIEPSLHQKIQENKLSQPFSSFNRFDSGSSEAGTKG
jgi:hypothetical protein